MKFTLVSTRNVMRIMDAAKALERRLSDPEIMGIGLIYGRPGLGKTMAINSYHARTRKANRIRTAKVRAMAHWSEASMMKAILVALGTEPRGYRMDLMMDQIEETLKPAPAVILIDEMDSIAGSRQMAAVLKDVHDVTGSAILMIGEQRVDALLRRYESFYNRMNTNAVVQCLDHDEADVTAVIDQRCEFPVDPKVSAEIYQFTGGKSMRTVVDTIRAMEEFARANGVARIGMAEYRASQGRPMLRQIPPNPPFSKGGTNRPPLVTGDTGGFATGTEGMTGTETHPTMMAEGGQ